MTTKPLRKLVYYVALGILAIPVVLIFLVTTFAGEGIDLIKRIGWI